VKMTAMYREKRAPSAAIRTLTARRSFAGQKGAAA
jgi:hypothetical protein